MTQVFIFLFFCLPVYLYDIQEKECYWFNISLVDVVFTPRGIKTFIQASEIQY